MDIAGEFQQFMACMISIENLQKLSSQSLVEFKENLEVFRREPLQETSNVIAKVVAVAPSARLTRYLAVGGWHEDPARLVAVKLDSTLKGLQTHIKQVRALLVEVESIVKRTSNLMQLELCSEPENIELSPFEIQSHPEIHHQVSQPGCIQRRLHLSDYVHMMSLILTMLVEDFKMQEKVVNALGLDTTMETLQAYSLMWILRPFVNEFVIEQASSWIKQI